MKKIILATLILAAILFPFEKCFGKECFGNFKIGGIDYTSHFYTPIISVDTLFNPGDTINLPVIISIVSMGSCGCTNDSVWWIYNGGINSNSMTYTIKDTGVYEIYAKADGDQFCDDDIYNYHLTLHVGYRSTISVSEISNPNILHVYPTISTGIFKIKTDAKYHINKIFVSDESGRIIYFSSTDFSEINLSRFAQGIYFYSAEDETGKVYRGRLIRN